MYFSLILALVGVSMCRGAIVPQSETRDDFSTDQSKQQGSTNTQVASPSTAYTSLQTSRLPSNQYYYPTYPEYPSTGYSGQSGYEGYLIPAAVSPQRSTHWVTEIAESLFPFSSQVIIYGARLGVYVLQLISMVVLGGAFTTLVCTLTPLCTISFQGFGFANNQVKEQVAELARTYITPESINTATVLVTKAIDRYAEMQREKAETERSGRKKRSFRKIRR